MWRGNYSWTTAGSNRRPHAFRTPKLGGPRLLKSACRHVQVVVRFDPGTWTPNPGPDACEHCAERLGYKRA